MSRMQPEHYAKYLEIRKHDPTRIGAIWVKGRGHFIRWPDETEEKYIPEEKLAALIERVYGEFQLRLPLEAAEHE